MMEILGRLERVGRSGSAIMLFLSFAFALVPAWNADGMLVVLEVSAKPSKAAAKQQGRKLLHPSWHVESLNSPELPTLNFTLCGKKKKKKLHSLSS